jgi:hypothetical protein
VKAEILKCREPEMGRDQSSRVPAMGLNAGHQTRLEAETAGVKVGNRKPPGTSIFAIRISRQRASLTG